MMNGNILCWKEVSDVLLLNIFINNPQEIMGHTLNTAADDTPLGGIVNTAENWAVITINSHIVLNAKELREAENKRFSLESFKCYTGVHTEASYYGTGRNQLTQYATSKTTFKSPEVKAIF